MGTRLRATCVLLLLLAACGGAPAATLVTPSPVGPSSASPASASPGGGQPTARAGGSPTGAPSVVLESPQDGATVRQGELTMSVNVSGIDVVWKPGKAPAPGEGHLIFYAGVDFIPTQPGRSAVTPPPSSVESDQLTSSWPSLTPGTYLIGVQVVNNDATPLVPPVVAKAKITIQ